MSKLTKVLKDIELRAFKSSTMAEELGVWKNGIRTLIVTMEELGVEVIVKEEK